VPILEALLVHLAAIPPAVLQGAVISFLILCVTFVGWCMKKSKVDSPYFLAFTAFVGLSLLLMAAFTPR
jgi:hypothetical protein